MNIKHLLSVALLFCSLSVSSQEVAQTHQDNPILGYYHLGMTIEEAVAQDFKIKENTEISDTTLETLSKYLIDINGIPFDVNGCGSFSGINYLDYNRYSSETLPLYFTGSAYGIDDKLVSMTIYSKKSENNEEFLCYMPAGLHAQKGLPSNRILFDVQNTKLHNRLVEQADNMVSYLSKKYGNPVKEFKIPTLPPSKKDDIAMDNFKTQWYSLCRDAAILPRAEWQQGNMTILMGISSAATLFISFFDKQALSHSNLEKYFKTAEPTKAKVAW